MNDHIVKDQLAQEIESCVYDVVFKELRNVPELTEGDYIALSVSELAAEAAYQAMKRYRKSTGQVYFCACKTCPGYSYRASERPHPVETCGHVRPRS